MAAASAQFPGAAFQAGAVIQTAWPAALAPALKGGVTVKFAFQASYAFQASAVLHIQDTWKLPQKDFCLSKGFATAPFNSLLQIN